jgi:hypothetical protein
VLNEGGCQRCQRLGIHGGARRLLDDQSVGAQHQDGLEAFSLGQILYHVVQHAHHRAPAAGGKGPGT